MNLLNTDKLWHICIFQAWNICSVFKMSLFWGNVWLLELMANAVNKIHTCCGPWWSEIKGEINQRLNSTLSNYPHPPFISVGMLLLGIIMQKYRQKVFPLKLSSVFSFKSMSNLPCLCPPRSHSPQRLLGKSASKHCTCTMLQFSSSLGKMSGCSSFCLMMTC